MQCSVNQEMNPPQKIKKTETSDYMRSQTSTIESYEEQLFTEENA